MKCTVSPTGLHFFEFANCSYCGKTQSELDSQEQALVHSNTPVKPATSTSEYPREQAGASGVITIPNDNSSKLGVEGWEDEIRYIDFKTIEDRDRCIAWINSLLSLQKQELREELLRHKLYIHLDNNVGNWCVSVNDIKKILEDTK